MKDRRRIPAGTPNGVYQIAARQHERSDKCPSPKDKSRLMKQKASFQRVQISDETEATQHRALFNELEARLGREECADRVS